MARERKFSKDDLFQATKHILLNSGYEGFTFSLLADRLKVSRGTLYKYYENKEELVTDYMIVKMNHFLTDLNQINYYKDFESQFDYLLMTMYKHSKIRKILIIANQILPTINEKVKANKQQLETLHIEMFSHLQAFIELGKKEKLLKPHIPNNLLLSFILQSIETLNHTETSQSEWLTSIKELLSHGMFTKQKRNGLEQL